MRLAVCLEFMENVLEAGLAPHFAQAPGDESVGVFVEDPKALPDPARHGLGRDQDAGAFAGGQDGG